MTRSGCDIDISVEDKRLQVCILSPDGSGTVLQSTGGSGTVMSVWELQDAADSEDLRKEEVQRNLFGIRKRNTHSYRQSPTCKIAQAI